MADFWKKKCVPCEAGAPALSGNVLKSYVDELKGGWELKDGNHIEKTFRFKNFAEALAFTNKIGQVAEEEGHHPDIYLSWGRAKVTLWTHKAKGLTENDFIMAAKIDRLN